VARLLTIHRAIVTVSERQRYLEKLKARKTYYAAAGCSFWVFEEVGLPGAFIEFTEATEPKTLGDAHKAALDPILDAGRIYKEVELS
jgi:hypothetical protein